MAEVTCGCMGRMPSAAPHRPRRATHKTKYLSTELPTRRHVEGQSGVEVFNAETPSFQNDVQRAPREWKQNHADVAMVHPAPTMGEQACCSNCCCCNCACGSCKTTGCGCNMVGTQNCGFRLPGTCIGSQARASIKLASRGCTKDEQHWGMDQKGGHRQIPIAND